MAMSFSPSVRYLLRGSVEDPGSTETGMRKLEVSQLQVVAGWVLLGVGSAGVMSRVVGLRRKWERVKDVQRVIISLKLTRYGIV